MKNPSTRELFAYWNERRGDRLAPERGDIEPGAIRRVLGDSFILSFDRKVDHPFRLAGTRVCAIFGRELKGEPFVYLWEAADRAHMRDLLAIVADEATGVVAGATAKVADGKTAELELLLLPLLHQGQPQVRLLGALSPIQIPFWLGRDPVVSLTLGVLRHLDPEIRAAPAPQLLRGSQDGLPPPALTLYQGGRSRASEGT
jgi:hypothetical protein